MKRVVLFLLVAAVLLAGLWIGLRPAPPAAVATTAAEPSAEAAPASVKRFELSFPASEPTATVLQVMQGELVEVQVTSARDDELHLHGYELAVPLQAGVPGTLRVLAEHAGRFELELHGAHAEIAVLEVQPR